MNSCLKVLLTMPVSTATTERSFSGYMSKTMLSGLALLYIQHDTNSDIAETACDFDASGTQRIALCILLTHSFILT